MKINNLIYYEQEYDFLNKNINSYNIKNIFVKNCIYIIILLFIITQIIFINVIIYSNLKYKIKVKENKIIILKNEILNQQILLQKLESSKINNNKNKDENEIEEYFLYDKSFFKTNFMFSYQDKNRIGYFIIFQSYSIEKELSRFKLSPFNYNAILSLINTLKKDLKFNNIKEDFSFINGINILRKFRKKYRDNNWKDKIDNITLFLKHFKNIKNQEVGTFIKTKDEIKKDFVFNYKIFVKSRHSTRNYKNMSLAMEDIESAIKISKYSPSISNRQFIKVHYYPEGKMKKNIINYSYGKGGLYLDGVNTFIISFDENGLISVGERNQGYLNAGLFAMNFVNALHSLGIGSCFIQFSNTIKEEDELKKINEIPLNERIAVILYAGYYDNKSILSISPRKEIKKYIKIHD